MPDNSKSENLLGKQYGEALEGEHTPLFKPSPQMLIR